MSPFDETIEAINKTIETIDSFIQDIDSSNELIKKMTGGMEKLKNCPFCGGKADFEKKDNYSAHTFYRVVCRDCGCGTYCDEDGYGYEDNPGKQKAAEIWNRRHI